MSNLVTHHSLPSLGATQEIALRNVRTHPLVLAAAGAVLVFATLGSAAILGWLPSAQSSIRSGYVNQDAVAPAALKQVDSDKTQALRKTIGSAGCGNCGTVSSIQRVRTEGRATGVGMVAGGVTGALVGNQFGRGNGRTAMTVIGAAGGAYAGNEIEKNVKADYVYRVTVRMEDGSYRTVAQPHTAFAVGDPVRITNGRLQSRS